MRSARIMIFVLTHSDDDSGNLQLSPQRFASSVSQVREMSTSDMPALILFDQWVQTIFSPKLQSMISRCDTTVAFLACGALVRTPDTFRDLVHNAERYVTFRYDHRVLYLIPHAA